MSGEEDSPEARASSRAAAPFVKSDHTCLCSHPTSLSVCIRILAGSLRLANACILQVAGFSNLSLDFFRSIQLHHFNV